MWLRCVADELCNALVRCGFEGWEYLHHQGSSGRVWLLHEMAEKEVTLVHIPRLEPSKKLTMKFKEDEIVGTLGLDTACKNCCMGGHYLDVPFCELAAAGTKDALWRGSRRYSGACKGHNRCPQLPLQGLSGVGFAVSGPWSTAHTVHSYSHSTQDRQCHLIVRTELWLGRFAVWSYPLLHPWDIQIWEAVPLPANARHVPMNALVASRV